MDGASLGVVSLSDLAEGYHLERRQVYWSASGMSRVTKSRAVSPKVRRSGRENVKIDFFKNDEELRRERFLIKIREIFLDTDDGSESGSYFTTVIN